MQFTIEDEVFEQLPNVCFGVVVARNLDNRGSNGEVNNLLRQAQKVILDKFSSAKPKDHPDLLPYREAFIKLGINPNKFPSSIEALSKRVTKGGKLPDINPIVNLVNAYSLKYSLPMGAHDLDTAHDNIIVRFSEGGDRFIPFGQTEPEIVGDRELVYTVGNNIKTRKWIWRQSNLGKVTEASKNVFFPIDGFSDINMEKVLEAREEMSHALEKLLGGRVEKYYLDIKTRSVLL